MLTVSGLYIYPIKSLGGIAVSSAAVTSRGLHNDRRWMLVDDSSRFLTQREYPVMALLQVACAEGGFTVHHKNNTCSVMFVPHATPTNAETVTVQIWDDSCEAQLAGKEINEWFSDALNMQCRLVYMPDSTNREVDKAYAPNNEITSFSDAYPFLLVGQPSVDELNTRLEEPLSMNRFRPNIVFTGGRPFLEDSLEEFIICGIHFFGVKLCARCVVTTINQDNAGRGKEPLKTLATYRMKNNKIYFGQNLLHKGTGVLTVGHKLDVIKTKEGFV
jgi:uncharacterized protein YcbX